MTNQIQILSFKLIHSFITSPPTLKVAERVSWRLNVAGNNKTYFGLQAKCPKILRDCKKKEPILNLMEIRPVGAAWTDGRTDRRTSRR